MHGPALLRRRSRIDAERTRGWRNCTPRRSRRAPRVKRRGRPRVRFRASGAARHSSSDVPGRIGGRHQHQLLGAYCNACRRLQEALLKLTRKIARARDREATRQFHGGHTLRAAPRVPGVSSGFSNDPVADMDIDSTRGGRDDQSPGIIVGQAAQDQLRQARQLTVLRRFADPKSISTDSARMRRATNPKTWADAASSHCTSSMTHSKGCVSRYFSQQAERRQRNQKAVRNVTRHQPERHARWRSAEAPEDAQRRRAAARRADAVRQTATPSRTASPRSGIWKPEACSTQCSTSAVLPIPASPRTTRAALPPARTFSRSPANCSRSEVLPRKTGER